MSYARYFAQKADHVLWLAKQIKENQSDTSAVELALISLANEFMAKAEHEVAMEIKLNGKGKAQP
jgi:hypothetical protein